MKYKSYTEIPQFTRSGSYRVDSEWRYLEETLARWADYEKMGSGLVLDPDFQRGHVWTEDKQRAYVEYILRGGKSSRDLYFNCSSWQGNYNTPIYLVDGKQRLEAVMRYLRNDLEIFDGMRHDDFDGRTPTHATFTINMNNLKTRAEMLQWYLDLNSGGVVHTSEELEKVKKLLEAERKTGKK